MAILLQEEGLYDRTTIYATDFNQQALDRAREGIFSAEMIKDYTYNYQKSGGQESFSNYYTSKYNMAVMGQSLKKNIVWANHNLVTDGVFACVADRLADSLSRNAPVYAYEFDDPHAPAPKPLRDAPFPVGASHSLELRYLFSVGGAPALDLCP